MIMRKLELATTEKFKRSVFRKTVLFGRCGNLYAAALMLLVLSAASTTLLAQSAGELDRGAVLGHLNAAINWYRDATSKVQTGGLPSDAIYQDNAQSLAVEAVRLAFESSRAEAKLISTPEKPGAAGEGEPVGQIGEQEKFSQMLARVTVQVTQAQAQIERLDKQIASARGGTRDKLIAQRQNLEGAIELDKAMEDAIQKMAVFAEINDSSAKGLQGSINDLARSIPEVLGTASVPGTAKKAVPGQAVQVAPVAQPQAGGASAAGLVGQALNVYSEMRSIHEIDKLIAETASLRAQVTELQKPLRANLTATVQRGRALANLPEPAGSNPAAQPTASAPAPAPATPQTPASPGEFQALTDNFKQLSSALIPLNQETIVLDESRSNFLEWRRSIIQESGSAVRSLMMRVVGLALALGLVFVLSNVWQRLAFRYIQEPRLRHQVMILRRFVIGFLIGVVLVMGFVSEFSSLATFAGFVTAGIAVGLQAVLLSVAAYFFVVGRYGISVGDRISIAGVTGDVIDIGIVRLYLMEMAGTGIDFYPTGRIVVFANSVLFQAGTPLYKQIPGADYTWHEVVVALTPDANYKAVQDKMLGVVKSVYEQYRASIERQYGDIQRRAEIQLRMPSPEGRMQFADAGLEFVVRYPLEIKRAAEVDDNITRRVLEAIAGEPTLKAAILGAPKIRALVR